MGFMAIVNAYTMRVSLSVAITEMVLPLNTTEHYDPNACPAASVNSTHTIIVSNHIYRLLTIILLCCLTTLRIGTSCTIGMKKHKA